MKVTSWEVSCSVLRGGHRKTNIMNLFLGLYGHSNYSGHFAKIHYIPAGYELCNCHDSLNDCLSDSIEIEV